MGIQRNILNMYICRLQKTNGSYKNIAKENSNTMKTKNLYICELGRVTYHYLSIAEWESLNIKIICRKSDEDYNRTYKDVLNGSKYLFWGDMYNSGIGVGEITPLSYPKKYISKRKIKEFLKY